MITEPLAIGIFGRILGLLQPRGQSMGEQLPGEKSDEQWRAELSPETYQVMRKHGTERAGTSPLNKEHRAGSYRCAACDQALFESDTKFDSGTGWPSFFRPLPGSVATTTDRTYGMTRVEVHCARCGGHLGHVFPDGPKPTGERYCMNGAALRFAPGEGTAIRPHE